MVQTGIVIVAHGSRGERGASEVIAALHRLGEGVKSLLGDAVHVTGAALQFNQPGLNEAVATLADTGAERIIIAPYFLFPGRHITEDIPALIDTLRQAYPRTTFLLAGNLGLNETFASIMAKRIIAAAPDLASRNGGAPSRIEVASMDIVQSLLPPLPTLSRAELTVVKRIVHATGDPGIAPLVRFSPTAIASGIAALKSGRPVFTDVRMAATGIDARLALSFGCPVACALDEAPSTPDADHTRTESAMLRLGNRLAGAIVVIGNAPTALLATVRLIDSGTRPALVVGIPVGFVQAAESKDALMSRDVPYITVVGTRGGSPLAAAATNALLKLASEAQP